jgi:hypothetical protein
MPKEYTEVEICILYIAEKDNKETIVMLSNQIYITLLKEECKLMLWMFIKKYQADQYGGVDFQSFSHLNVEFTAYRIFQ